MELDKRGISCISTPSESKFATLINRGLDHLRMGGAQSRLPGANQLWMLIGFAMFAVLKRRWECIEVFPHAIAATLGASKDRKTTEEGLRTQLEAVRLHTCWPESPGKTALGPIAYGAFHDKLDAYMSAWIASLEEKDREPLGKPPDDAIWVPRTSSLQPG